VVYRIHEPPSREKLVALKDYLATFDASLALGQVITPSLFNRMLKDVSDESEKALIMEAVLRSQTQAYYGPRNAGHFGLRWVPMPTSPHRSGAMPTCWSTARWSTRSGWSNPHPRAISPRTPACRTATAPICPKSAKRSAMPNAAPWMAERETIDRYVAAWLSARVGEVFECRVTGVQRFGLFATIIGLGGDGLVPISVLGKPIR
jgi:ribonuclease R